MGYTTKFQGSFVLDKQMNDCKILDLLNEWNDGQGKDARCPNSYCQWVLSKDRKSLQWDGNEKFYDYEAWLQLVHDMLNENGYILTGQVEYQGEEVGDSGTLAIVNHKAVKTEFKTKIHTCPECGHQFREKN